LSTLQGLPEQQRAALVLREMEGRSYEEISQELGVSQGAVGQLLARARQGLQSGASAVLPAGLLLRAPDASGGMTPERVAELVSAGGAAGVAKAVAVIAVAGGVGGAVLTPGGEVPSKARDRSGKELSPPIEPAAREEARFSSGTTLSDRGQTRVRRDGPERDRAGRDRTGDHAAETHGGTRDTGPSPAPEARSDEDEIVPAAPLGDDDGSEADDDNPDPAPPPPSEPEDDTQDLDSDNDVAPVPDVAPDTDVEPDHGPGD
jgi:hypothetical protein